jgi:hypothetical protein
VAAATTFTKGIFPRAASELRRAQPGITRIG